MVVSIAGTTILPFMIEPTDAAFRHYFWFMQERMRIFWNRYEDKPRPWTSDEDLQTYKFTNVYRACDRVSQYLIRRVIYVPERTHFSALDVLLRILVFKVFNKVDTWEYLEYQLGEPLTTRNYDPARLTRWLTELQGVQAIFNSAYIMTGSHRDYTDYRTKHERWLHMIQAEMLDNERLQYIADAPSLRAICQQLKACPFIGDFLACQYTIDFNYSEVVDFDENTFIAAGIGAIRGIKKCFRYDSRYSYEDYIRHTQEHLEHYQNKYGYTEFRNLFGRAPHLIDFQNVFCETDKLLRVKMPKFNLGQKRIKRKFKPGRPTPDYFFPPKWGLNRATNRPT